MYAGLIAAMEEVDNEEVVVTDTEAEEVVATVADESAEIQQEQGEAEISVAQVEDAVQAGEELEEIAEVASEAVESGEGLSEESAEMASIAIESIRSRLGFRSETRLVPATESFGNTNTRLVSTKLIIEGIGDTVKKIWLAIKAAAARLWEKIKLFIANLLNSTKGLLKMVATLRERIRKLPKDATKLEENIKVGSVARGISIKGVANLSTFNSVVQNTQKLLDGAEVISQKVGQLAAHVQTVSQGLEKGIGEDGIKKLDDAGEAVAKAVSAIGVKDFTSEEIANLKSKLKGRGALSQLEAYGPFGGRSAFVVYAGDNSTTRIGLVTGAGKAAEEVKALDAKEMEGVLNVSESLIKRLDAIKKVSDSAEKSLAAMQKTAEAVAKNAEKAAAKAGGKEQANALKAMREQASSSMSAMSAIAVTAPTIGFSTAKAGLDYVSASLRNLREKAE